MAELSAVSACAGLLPLAIGNTAATEEDLGAMTSLMPFRGQGEALSGALEAAHGAGLPQPGGSTGKVGSRVLWFGQNHYLLLGPEPDPALSAHAALADQSDAWAAVRLEGGGAEDVLARLVPVDFRASVFKPGATVRSELMHMMASITRTGPESFLILVFRSMAGTLVHDLKTAMEGVAARG